MGLLREAVYGNPHSVNPTSSAATGLVERARRAVLRYFNAPEHEYACIFTPNATGALRLVGEAYPFASGDRFLATFDNHNSVNGIREFARARGARTSYVPLRRGDLRVPDGLLERYLDDAATGGHNLFAYPAQSNFSGVKHPLEWISLAHERGWDVLVDCAAFVPTNRLDLSVYKPDFVPISFYKMFGYPTGLGALIARRDAARPAAAPVVQRRHRRRGERPGGHGRAPVRPCPVRGRHGQLPRHPGCRDRPASHRVDRHRHDLQARRDAGHLADRGPPASRTLGRQPGGSHLRPDGLGPAWGNDRAELPAPGRARSRRAVRRSPRRRAPDLASGPAASATRARERRRSRSHATR